MCWRFPERYRRGREHVVAIKQLLYFDSGRCHQSLCVRAVKPSGMCALRQFRENHQESVQNSGVMPSVPPVEAPSPQSDPCVEQLQERSNGESQHRRNYVSRICCGAFETCSAGLSLPRARCLPTRDAEPRGNPRMPTSV